MSFIEQVTYDLTRRGWENLRNMTVVFPMHRAALFMKEELKRQMLLQHLDRPVLAPRFTTLSELTDELWTAIAARFKGNPTVAMYDLLNEPMCDVPENGIVRRINNEKIYTRLYNTVRAVDPDHAISLECIWTPFALPHKQLKGWTNVVYQVHFYETTDFVFSWNVLMTRMWYLNTPLLMGEFYPHKQTTWENCFKKMNQANFSWMLWTYKATGHGMWDGDWCLFGSKDGFWRAKVKTDSFEDIAYKWGERQQTQIGFQDSGHYERDVKAYL